MLLCSSIYSPSSHRWPTMHQVLPLCWVLGIWKCAVQCLMAQSSWSVRKAVVTCTHNACKHVSASTHMHTHTLVYTCVCIHYNQTLRKHRGGREPANPGCWHSLREPHGKRENEVAPPNRSSQREAKRVGNENLEKARKRGGPKELSLQLTAPAKPGAELSAS